MAINFPATPTLNQTYTYNGRTWTYNNVGWQATGSTGLTVYTKTNFTATAAQTTFSVTYTVGFVDVYYNGSKLSSSEYTATTGSTVVLGTACSVNDIVETIAWTISSSFNPSLGSASATSLAIGGATIGSNALAVTGTTQLNSALNYGGVTLSNAVTGTGNMVLSAGPTLTGSAAGQTNNAASETVWTVLNNSASNGAFAILRTSNGTSSVDFGMTGTGYAGVGAYIANQAYIRCDAANGVGIYAPTGPIKFVGSGFSEVARFDTSGRLGIGMTPTAGYGALQAYTGAGGTQIGIGLAATVGLLNYFGNDFQISSNATLSSAGAWTARYTAAALMELRGDGSIVFQSNTGLTAGNSFSPTERARFDTSGNFLVGKTTTGSTGNGSQILPTGFAGFTLAGSTSATDTLDVFSTAAGVFRFYVDMGGTIHATSATITAISDRTLKTNIRPLDTGLKEIMGLQPRRFDWINGDGENVVGFVAQEVEEVLPELVTSSKYSVDENGDTVTKKAVKTGDMIPTLVKAIQELTTRLAALEAK